MTIGERIKYVRGSQAREVFAPSLQVSKNTLIAYEKDERSPGADFLNRILQQYPNINPAWLLAGEGPSTREEMPPGYDISPFYASTEEIEEDYILVPRYNVNASAGGGAVVHSEQVVDYLAFKAEWVNRSLGIPKDGLALITVQGDSMEPTFASGDLILIDLRAMHIKDEAVYVLSINNSLVVKRAQQRMDKSVILKSDNTLYEPEVLTPDQVERLVVVGRVVWFGRRL